MRSVKNKRPLYCLKEKKKKNIATKPSKATPGEASPKQPVGAIYQSQYLFSMRDHSEEENTLCTRCIGSYTFISQMSAVLITYADITCRNIIITIPGNSYSMSEVFEGLYQLTH